MQSCTDEEQYYDSSDQHDNTNADNMTCEAAAVEPTSAAPPQPSPATIPSDVEPFCWMCKFHGNPVCDKAAVFVVDVIAHVSFTEVVEQLFTHLNSTFPSDNISKKQLITHIREHMLHPRIKMARMIHRLSEMQSSITQNVVSHDAESNQTIIDSSAVKLYAVISNQILSLYKTDEEKLMFRNISMDK
jgi:hypothetical protein